MMTIPYIPPDDLDEWRETYEMLCGFCDHQFRCHVIEHMIEMKDGGPWPDAGWVLDQGAGVSCLSYKPKPGPKVARQEIRQIKRTPEDRLPPVCKGCAARKGTEASVSRHTRLDFKSAVANKTRFLCHETGATCGGWCRAIRGR